MEFVEYYRIVRQRVWLPVLVMVIAAAAVLLVRMLRPPPLAAANGTLICDPSAGEEIRIEQDAVRIVVGLRWEAVAIRLINAIQSDEMHRSVAAGLGLAPGAADFSLAAQADPANGIIAVTGDASAPDVASRAASLAMEYTIQGWQQRQVLVAKNVRDALLKRQREAALRLAQARGALNAWRLGHGRSDPTVELQVIQNELATIGSSRAESLLALEGARARLTALKAGFGVPTEEEGETGIGPIVQPLQVAAPPELDELRQAETELQQLLETKTPRHPRVLALRRRTEELRKALPPDVAQAPLGTPAAAPGPANAAREKMRMMVFEEQLAAGSLARQIEWLDVQQTAKRDELDNIMAGQPEFAELSDRLALVQAGAQAVQDMLDQVDAYESRLTAMWTPPASSDSVATVRPLEFGKKVGEGTRPRGLKAVAIQLVLAMFLGGALGIMLAFMLHYVDTSFRDEAYTEQTLGHRVIGSIPVSDLPVAVATGPPAPEDD